MAGFCLSGKGYKQAILVRNDLKMGKGKIAAQAAHASLASYKNADKKTKEAWESLGCKKVVLKVNDEKELLKYLELARDANLPNALITDAGLTQIPASTTTCLGIGPAEEEKVDKIVKELKLL
jgi:peptidyl-tRNA hydrolase, PTH2 family